MFPCAVFTGVAPAVPAGAAGALVRPAVEVPAGSASAGEVRHFDLLP